MKILIAPDKFKGSLSALAVAEAIAKGIKRANPSYTCHLHPLADGGDGSVQVLSSFLDLEEIPVQVVDPLGKPLNVSYHLYEDTAFVELAQASGLVLVPESDRNPLETTTYGTGLLIRNAIEKGAKKVFLFLGGSATNDGGMGIAQALEVKFLAEDGKELEPKGKNLANVHQIIPSEKFSQANVQLYCLCDVKNPLLGPNGASFVYAEQKGATPQMVNQLEMGMKNFATVVEKQIGIGIDTIEGGGAAGGIAAGLYGLFHAKIQSGIDTILALSKFEERLKKVDLVISGEGRFDSQTLEGKVIKGVLDLCRAHEKELVLFVGQNLLSEEVWKHEGIKEVLAILTHAQNVEEAIQDAGRILEEMAFGYLK
ncbi:MAG: glycerate kinase, partial [Bacteroidota bacterium]